MKKVSKLKIYTDGGSRGNPGPSATGWLIYDAQNLELLTYGGKFLGESTNNEAEFTALLEAITKALEYTPDEISCFLDSELLVRQLNGQYKIKAPHLKEIIEKIFDKVGFVKVKFQHVLREKNKEADSIVNKILDKYEGKSL